MGFSSIKQILKSKEYLEEFAEDVYKKYLEMFFGIEYYQYRFGPYETFLKKSIRSYDDGIIYKNKETKELEGFILTRHTIFYREHEILLLVSPDIKIMFKLLKKFIDFITMHGPAIAFTYIIDNEELKILYQELGFILEKSFPSRFSGDKPVILMRFNNGV